MELWSTFMMKGVPTRLGNACELRRRVAPKRALKVREKSDADLTQKGTSKGNPTATQEQRWDRRISLWYLGFQRVRQPFPIQVKCRSAVLKIQYGQPCVGSTPTSGTF